MGMSLKSHPLWLRSCTLDVWTTAIPFLTFKCTPLLDGQGRCTMHVWKTINRLLWSVKFKLDHVSARMTFHTSKYMQISPSFPYIFFFFWPCHMACGTLVLPLGIKSGPWQRKGQVLTTGLPGNSLSSPFLIANSSIDQNMSLDVGVT